MKMFQKILRAVIGLLLLPMLGAQVQIDPYWRTVGKGLESAKPATCRTQKDVYICTDCNGGRGAILYCNPVGTSANTWYYLNFESSGPSGGLLWSEATGAWSSYTATWSAI